MQRKYKLITTQLNSNNDINKTSMCHRVRREGDRRVTVLHDPDLAAEDLNCNLRFLYYPTNLEKFGELYETPLSE